MTEYYSFRELTNRLQDVFPRWRCVQEATNAVYCYYPLGTTDRIRISVHQDRNSDLMYEIERCRVCNEELVDHKSVRAAPWEIVPRFRELMLPWADRLMEDML